MPRARKKSFLIDEDDDEILTLGDPKERDPEEDDPEPSKSPVPPLPDDDRRGPTPPPIRRPDKDTPEPPPLRQPDVPPRPGVPEPRSPAARYESRISIVEAWQYPGSLNQAPDWIDKNWAGYGDFDPLRAIEPGPCLRVPDKRGGITLARIGDYVCRQTMRISAEFAADEAYTEVWEQAQFERLFLPVQ